MYAIEAVRLFDHYAFRKYMEQATSAKPLTLWYPGKPGAPTPWWKPYYDKTDIKLRDRCLFAQVPLPAGLETVKKADWSSLEKKTAPGPTPKGRTKPATRPAAKRKTKTAPARAPKGGPKPAKRPETKRKTPVKRGTRRPR